MQQEQKFSKLLLASAIGHVFVLAILVVSFEFNSHNFVIENSKDAHIINAIVLDSSKIQKANPTPVTPKSIVKQPEPLKPLPKPENIKPLPKPAESKPIPAPSVKKESVPTPPKKVIAIPDHTKKIKKELLEKELLSELKQAQKNKKHKELEREFQKELKAAKKLKAAEAQRAKALEQQLQSEQDRLASSQAQKMQGVVDKYKALILQSIAEHWLVPNGVDRSLSSELLIRVSVGGTVLDVQLVKSSGDDALDRSARTAVFKASPLPVPSDPDEFRLFKEFILKVKPENILNRDNGLN